MMNGRTMNLWKAVAVVMLWLVSAAQAFAQSELEMARTHVVEGQYDIAIKMYERIYRDKGDTIYREYVDALIQAKEYKDAIKLAEKNADKYPKNTPLPDGFVELGRVYDKCGKSDKAKEQFDEAIKRINGDDILTNRIAKAFIDMGRDDYAITTFETALQKLGNPPMYGRQLAILYGRAGELEKALEAMLGRGPSVFMTAEQAKELLLEMLGTDPAKLRRVQKALVKRLNEEPGNNYYGEILTWVYTQKDDWEGALIQIEAIDARNNEAGRRILELARRAVAERRYELASKAYDDVIAKGKDNVPHYMIAKSEKLAAGLAQLEHNPNRTPEDVTALAAIFDSFLVEFPSYYKQQVASDFARLQAQYGNNVQRAIAILNKGINDPGMPRQRMGAFKLQLGDYYLLAGRIWDASLTYSQVDKEFKQDVMGEDARFRNARLAYYQGDFDLAQKQLGILKSGTSNLISNDAIDLSVLITENVEDSATLPLERFAYAGLLLFQNRDKEAEDLVDSITKAFPEHPLGDDLMMMRAQIAMKHLDYPTALQHLKVVIDKYGDDVLGDDAVYRTAEIYQNELHQPEEAKKYFEQLIIDYPGSTFVQAARQKLADLKSQGVQ